MKKQKVIQAAKSLVKNLNMSLPVMVGVLLLIGLINTAVPKEFFSKVFTGRLLMDPLAGALFGGIAAGNPLTSYIIGGELADRGVSLVAILAFLVSWVTVGTIQLPAESLMLGRRFALMRNLISFIMAILIALLTVFTLELIG